MSRVLVTGSSTGLGLMAAQRLLAAGHEVTVHARDESRAGDLRQELPDAPLVTGDLSSIAQTRRVAEQVGAIGRHDAVIHNAAVYRVPRRVETEDGLSLTFAVNVLAPYLLTALLDPADRLVYMTSGLLSGGDADLSDAQWTRRGWQWMQAYSDSKLYDAMLAFGLARRRPGTFSNAVNPGWVPTRMGGAGAPDDLEQGAATQVWLAAGDDPAADVTAQYVHHKRSEQVPQVVRDEEAQETLFTYCENLTGTPLP